MGIMCCLFRSQIGADYTDFRSSRPETAKKGPKTRPGLTISSRLRPRRRRPRRRRATTRKDRRSRLRVSRDGLPENAAGESDIATGRCCGGDLHLVSDGDEGGEGSAHRGLLVGGDDHRSQAALVRELLLEPRAVRGCRAQGAVERPRPLAHAQDLDPAHASIPVRAGAAAVVDPDARPVGVAT